jgi:DivIVA domain-containing protein
VTSNGQRFRRRSLRRGYKVDEVDSFLDRVEATLNGERIDKPVRAQEVHDVVFRVGFGGYDEWQVDLHLDRVERQLADMEPSESFVPDRMSQERMAQDRLAHERLAQERHAAERLPDRGLERGMPERLPERMPMDRGPERVPMPERMPERPGDRMAPQMDRSMMGMPSAGGPPPGAVSPPLSSRPAPGMGGPGGPGGPPPGFPRYDEGTYGGDPGYDNPTGYPPPPGYRQAPGSGFPPPPYRGPDPYEADQGGYPTSQYPTTTPSYPPEPQRFPPPPGPGPEYGGGPGYPGRGYEETGRQPRMDMTTEMRASEAQPAPPGPPTGPSMPAGDLQRVDQLRRTFQPRRFGSGYDRAEVDQLFEGILTAMSGRSPRPIGPDDLDNIRFNLVPGGYYEDEVDNAIREVRQILADRR